MKITITKKPKLKKPVLICVWPGMGEVAFKLGIYLKDKLKMEEFATLEADELFPATGVWIENSLIQLPKPPAGAFYFYKSQHRLNKDSTIDGSVSDIILFISSAQPLLEQAKNYCNKILSLSKELKVKRVFTFAALPQTIDHTAPAEVWFAASSKKLLEELTGLQIGLKPLISGQVSGLNGLLLGVAKEMGLDGVCLLGEIPLFMIQIENPRSSLSILEKLKKILKIEVDSGQLIEQVKFMEQEIEKLIDFIQSPEQEKSPIGQEEIDKIKNALTLYTKLPQSAREKIEKLFQEVKTDIAKAAELKKELDNWNVYKEYEDRFLDLFKKPKDKEEKSHN